MNKSYVKAIGMGLLSILSVKSFAGGNVTASFTSTTVCEGSTTIVTSTSTTTSGNIVSWNWDLDNDGNFDNASGPSINGILPSSGTFPIGLEVTTNLSETATVYLNVVVNPLPNAAFTANDVCKGEPTTLTSSSTVTPGSIASWNWDFDNNSFFNDGSGQTVAHDFQNSGTYIAGLQVVSDLGCVSQVYNTITVNPLPNATFTFENVCIGDITHFTASANVTSGSVTGYTWDFNDDNIFGDETGAEVDFEFLSAGFYPVTLRVTTDEGCSSETTDFVTIAPLPVIIFNFTGECEGAPVQFLNQSSNQVGSIEYLWSFGDSEFSDDVNPSHVYASEGTYTINLTGTSSYGCVNSATQSITINPGPSASFTYNEVCTGFITDFVNTSTSGGSNVEGYLWTFGDNDASVAQSPSHQYGWAGTYPVTLVVSSTEGCRDTATANVNVWALPTPHIAAAGPLAFCDGGSVDLSVDLDEGQSAIWSNAQTTATITVTETGQYIVNVFDEHGCQQKDTMDVLVWALPNVTASNDTMVSLGYNANLWAAGATFYNWSPETYLDNANVYDPTSVSPLETITYTVTGTDDNGCTNTADVIVTVNADYTFETVNLFTPNGDGFNDFWKIKNVNLYSDCVVKVFNRWGIEVYSSTAYQNDWDGTYKGEKLPEATYYYVVTCSGTEKEYDGAISILRNKN